MVELGKAELILTNGQFHTVDRENPQADAVAIRDGKFLAVGTLAEAMQHHCAGTRVIDLQGHAAIPGLNDSHLHLIRGGLNYNLELRWERGSVSGRCLAHVERAGITDTFTAVGACGGWLDRIPVR
jgi:Predicted metal-dependent hydrolase with the TIM-barrel fold